MSALQFISQPKSQECCIVKGCLGRERWRPMIAGYVLEDAPLCSRHKRQFEDDWTRALTEYAPPVRKRVSASERALRQAA